LARFLEENEKKVGYVNLDTGVKTLPYIPTVDVREHITVEELMKKGIRTQWGYCRKL